MDREARTIDIVKEIHRFQNNEIDNAYLIKQVCKYYDLIKNERLTQADLQFLMRIANIVGIPHYFDNLELFQTKDDITLKNISLSTLSAKIYESTLHTDEKNKIHKYQKEILFKFTHGKQNRYFLSASTSFGKTHLVYEILRKMQYRNIVLIFPTIALLTENLDKLRDNPLYQGYTVHTISEVKEETLCENNIFVYTPERFLSFLDRQTFQLGFDFIFIDEVYKIDNEYIIHEQVKENQRDTSYRIAAYYALLGKTDIFLAGPYIEKCSMSFERFLNDNQIIKLDYNQYELVNKTNHETQNTKQPLKMDDMTINFKDSKKSTQLKEVANQLNKNKENFIIYCSGPTSAEKNAKALDAFIVFEDSETEYQEFLKHVEIRYGQDWVLTECLKKGIGIHHGLVPKYIQKEIINFFNKGYIKATVATTTITEGVNTSAKNLIILHNKKGKKELKRFDAKNIAGRAGRFDKHYKGRVIVIQNKFLSDLNKSIEDINHKNYDYNSQKDEVDIFYSKDEFLTEDNKLQRNNINQEQSERKIPDNIINMFKIVSKSDKIAIYDSIKNLTEERNQSIRNLIQRINTPPKVSIDWDGFQIVLECLQPHVSGKLENLLKRKTNNNKGKHFALIPKLHNYLEKGFGGLVNFKKEEQSKETDEAIRDTAEFVYNIVKYDLVKYLGVFNIMYKFYRSQLENKIFEEIGGIDKLLSKLEYNALTEIGRKVSDYGVPEAVLNFYEANNKDKQNISNSFDSYEKKIFEKVNEIFVDT